MNPEYLEHPIYDESKASEWIDLNLNHKTNKPAGGDTHPLAEIVLRDFDQITKDALERIKSHETPDCLNQRPHPLLKTVSFCPISESGIRVFVEYFFAESLTQNSENTDIWWVILQCPYTTDPPYGLSIQYYIIDLGWKVY